MIALRQYVVIALLAVTTIAYYKLPHGDYVPPRRALEDFPRVLPGFRGQDIGMSSGERAVLGHGDFLQRTYWPEREGLPVFVYIGYYPQQETGDTVHSPQNCLPGGGWEAIDIRRLPIRLRDGRTVVVNEYVVQRNAERLVVLYWFQGRGRVVASEYWSKFYLIHDAIRKWRTDGAIIRVSAPVVRSPEQTAAYLSQFIVELNVHLQEFIPN